MNREMLILLINKIYLNLHDFRLNNYQRFFKSILQIFWRINGIFIAKVLYHSR